MTDRAMKQKPIRGTAMAATVCQYVFYRKEREKMDSRSNEQRGPAPDQQGECNASLGTCAQEVDRTEWRSFFQSFSKAHQGQPVTVEVRGDADQGARELASGMPLTGITADIRQEGQKQYPQVEVILGEARPGHMTHIIATPLRVWRHSENEREVVQIVDAAGVTTTIHLSA
jgi:hypothetical protein